MRLFPVPCSTLLILVCSLSLGCGDDKKPAGQDESPDAGDGQDSGAEHDAESELDDAGPSGPSLTIDALCTLLRENAETQYCTDHEDPAGCQQYITQSTRRCEALAQAVEQGRLRYDGQRLHACVEAMDEAELTTAFMDLWFDCEGAFSGQVPDGEDCYYDYAFGLNECGQALYCDRSAATCPGQCRPYQQEGEACPSAGNCAPELACLRDCTPPCEGTCGPRPKLGERCDTSWGLCAGDLVCDATTSPHSCVMRRPLGASCTRAYQCASLYCAEEKCAVKPVSNCATSRDCAASEACLLKNGVGACGPRVAAGESCTHAEDGCVEGYKCLSHPEDGTTECRKAGLDGDPCSPWGCEEDHYCANESENLVCRPDRATGEDCSDVSFDTLQDNSACSSGLHCMLSNTGTCLPAGGMGDPCYYNDTESCEVGLVCLQYVNSTCQPPSELTEICNPAFENACNGGNCLCTTMEGDHCNWTCVPKRANGDLCDDPSTCLSAYCDFAQQPSVCTDQPSDTLNICIP